MPRVKQYFGAELGFEPESALFAYQAFLLYPLCVSLRLSSLDPSSGFHLVPASFLPHPTAPVPLARGGPCPLQLGHLTRWHFLPPDVLFMLLLPSRSHSNVPSSEKPAPTPAPHCGYSLAHPFDLPPGLWPWSCHVHLVTWCLSLQPRMEALGGHGSGPSCALWYPQRPTPNRAWPMLGAREAFVDDE